MAGHRFVHCATLADLPGRTIKGNSHYMGCTR